MTPFEVCSICFSFSQTFSKIKTKKSFYSVVIMPALCCMVKSLSVTAFDCKYVQFLIFIYLISRVRTANPGFDTAAVCVLEFTPRKFPGSDGSSSRYD